MTLRLSTNSRFVAGAALTIGFYVVSLTVGGLLIVPYYWYIHTPQLNLIAFLLMIPGTLILSEMIPPRRRREPGILVSQESEPELFALVAGGVRRMNCKNPSAIMLTISSDA